MGYRDDLNVLRRMKEEEQQALLAQMVADPNEQGNFGAYQPPPDFGNVRGGASSAPVNVLAQMRQPQPEPMPQVMPRTTVEDPRRWQSEPGSDMPMNSFRVESGPDAGKTRSLNFADINPAWGNAQELQPDYSQPIEIAGVGKGYWEKGGTGNAIVNGQRVMLGVDREKTYRNQERAQKYRANEVNIARDQEAINTSVAARTIRDDATSQPALERKFGKADKGKMWTVEGRLVPIQGSDADEQSMGSIQGAQDTIAKIDAMIGTRDASGNLVEGAKPHPGFSALVGAKGPSAWHTLIGLPPVPGTDAADFKARLDEIKGGAFLQAFESLKGGGAITEVEGKKATDAITRMSTAQSEQEFVRAAQEFQGVVRRGMEKAQSMRGGKVQPTTQQGGDMLQQARDAIARGAPRAAVLARLQQAGINPSGL